MNRADRRHQLFLILAKQLAARSIDEMQPAASLADHGFVAGVRIAPFGFVSQPMLHVHTGAGTFEDEIIHRDVSLTSARSRVLTFVNVRARRMCDPASHPARRS